MKTIAIIAQKGGATKSTLAMHLAVEAELNGKTAVIIDVDPQQSSAFWKDLRVKETPVVETTMASRLPMILDAARQQGVDIVFVDTQANSNNIATISARNSDFVIIPTKCEVVDLKTVSDSVDIVRGAKKEGAIILCAVPPRGTKGERAMEALQGEGMEVCPITTGKREAYGNATDLGLTVQEYEPNGKSAEEIRNLYKWISAKINL